MKIFQSPEICPEKLILREVKLYDYFENKKHFTNLLWKKEKSIFLTLMYQNWTFTFDTGLYNVQTPTVSHNSSQKLNLSHNISQTYLKQCGTISKMDIRQTSANPSSCPRPEASIASRIGVQHSSPSLPIFCILVSSWIKLPLFKNTVGLKWI